MIFYRKYSSPQFIIIGAQKAGTSSLFEVLKQHPDLLASKTKEVHYFDNDSWYNSENTDDYLKQFPVFAKGDGRKLPFEATPRYMFHPQAAPRIFEFNPSMKMVVLLRNPIYRALSAWSMFHYHFKSGKRSKLHDPRSFAEAIEQDLKTVNQEWNRNKRSYVLRGHYADQISRYLEYFSEEQLLILESGDLRESFDSTLSQIFEFVGVRNVKLKPVIANKSRANDTLDHTETFQLLSNYYAEPNEKLFELLGRKFNWSI
jgi:hypothetical protein